MMQIIRMIVVTTVAGGLIWFLGKTVFQGILTGSIHHTDSTRTCCRGKHPAGFWALVVLFSMFIIGIGIAWAFALADVFNKLR